jgi:hypothetical protein
VRGRRGAEAEQAIYLLHPESLDAYPCTVEVTRRGLLLYRVADPAAVPGPTDPPLRVPWWTVHGFSADETDTTPDGARCQVLEVVTDAGSLFLLAPATEVGRLLAQVSRYSSHWHRSRRAGWAAVARTWALMVAAAVSLAARASGGALAGLATASAVALRGASATGRAVWFGLDHAGRAGATGAGRGWAGIRALLVPVTDRLVAGGRHLATTRPMRSLAAGMAWVAAGARVIRVVSAALLRPVARSLAEVTAPARTWLSRTLVGLAVAAGMRRVRADLAAVARLGNRGGRRLRGPVPVVGGLVAAVLATVLVLAAVGPGPTAIGAAGTKTADEAPAAKGLTLTGTVGGNLDTSSMARIVATFGSKPLHLPAATSTPDAAPPSLADAPPLRPHEIFGFAPYWTLSQSSGFDVGDMTTLAYFSIDVNADGSLDQSGSGWDGYQSQALVDLINRAHAVGTRVVLSVTCFDQGSLDQLTSDPSAPGRLSAALLSAIEAKNLDGVNLDFEGDGSADQQGLANLVAKVSSAIHGADPHYQVTMDTYASSAADAGGFYDIPEMASSVDGFFVMAYQLNYNATQQAESPLTSGMYTDVATAEQYSSVVPPSKVILGIPYYGYEWPTTDGTLSAAAVGGANPITYAQATVPGRPTYWDPVTDTAWSSYQSGGQWYEDFFEDPTSLYLLAELAQTYDLAGMGIWALGMDGNSAAMLAALRGFAPAVKTTATGPGSTSSSGPGSTSSTSTTTTSTPKTTTTTTTAPGPGSTTTTTGPPASTTTTTTAPPVFHYSGDWAGQTVALSPVGAGQVPGGLDLVGQLSGFESTNPAYSCLAGADISVWRLPVQGSPFYVQATTATSCMAADFVFTAT